MRFRSSLRTRLREELERELKDEGAGAGSVRENGLKLREAEIDKTVEQRLAEAKLSIEQRLAEAKLGIEQQAAEKAKADQLTQVEDLKRELQEAQARLGIKLAIPNWSCAKNRGEA